MENKDYVAALRELADFFEAHPELPGGDVGTINVAVGPEKLRALASCLGSFKKKADPYFYNLSKTVGLWTIDVYTSRSNLCEAVVVGKKQVAEVVVPARPEEVIPAHEEDIVEWHCPDSLLAPDEEGEKPLEQQNQAQ
ncbi:MAG TPA: hypothetical protein VN976_22135 [Verrucomicrobiae bacterium]|nr:hypothetical protein [Verrucomicrobiae bacterium]